MSSPSAITAVAASRWPCSSKKPVLKKSIILREGWMPGREPSIRRSHFIRRWTGGIAAAFACVALPAGAEDLVQVYRDAQRYDAVYGAARFSLEAGRERIPQGRALLLPPGAGPAHTAPGRVVQTSPNENNPPPVARGPTAPGDHPT